jgi:hypothetical protein
MYLDHTPRKSNERCTRRAVYGLRMLRMRFYLTRPQVS